MSRVAIVGTNAHPFLMGYWLKQFKNWEKEVDRVYIITDSPIEPYTWSFTKEILTQHPKIRVIETDIDWPNSLSEAVRLSEESHLLILHDDTFIYKTGVIDKYFKMCETGKVITPPHGIYAPIDLVEKRLKEKYPFMPFRVKGMPDNADNTGYSFLLYFLFISRIDLMKAGNDFDGKPGGYKANEYCKVLDFIPDRDFSGDTGFLLMLNLLKNGSEIELITRATTASLPYEQNPLLILQEWEQKKINVFKEGWVHIQAMGTGFNEWYWKFEEKNKIPVHKIDRQESNRNDINIRKGWMLRLAWMLEFMEAQDYTGIQDYKDYILSELNYIMYFFDINKLLLNDYRLALRKFDNIGKGGE